MRPIFLALLFIVSLQPAMAGGRNEETLRQTAAALDKALLTKDTVFMTRHLSLSLVYGHSNGWLQTSEEMKKDMYNGKLTYTQIVPKSEVSILIEGNTGLVRMHEDVEVKLEGQTLNLSLSILQVWVFKKGEWILIGRQSTRV
jgi:hypothetical protein